MKSYKDPTFQYRVGSAAQAKQKALDRLKAKPPVDEAVVAEKKAKAEAKEAAEVEKRAAKLAAKLAAEAEKKRLEEEEAARLAEEAEAARLAAEAAKPKQLTPEEKKAIRDARYAARKKKK